MSFLDTCVEIAKAAARPSMSLSRRAQDVITAGGKVRSLAGDYGTGVRGNVTADDMARTVNPALTASPMAGGALPVSQLPSPGPLPPPTPEREALRFQFPYSYNQQITPRKQSLTPFAILRQIAEVNDIVRICIETRKDQMTSLQWDIVSKDQKKKMTPGMAKKADELRTLFRRPDGKRGFHAWIRLAIEEVLAIDALSIYRQKTRGGDLFALKIIDGSTILPLLDDYGDTPDPPDVAYRQIIYGAPAVDMTREELIYAPRTVRANTPYGLSAVEAVLLTVNAALQREMFNLSYYAEGNVPEGFMDAPAGFTGDQIGDMQAILDQNLAGNLLLRRRIRIVGNGMSKSLTRLKEPDFTTAYDTWLVKIICAAFAVPPQEIGITQDVNRANAAHQENVVYRRGVKPLVNFFEDLLTDVIETDLDAPDFAFKMSGGEPEDELTEAKANQIKLNSGAVDLDDWRTHEGMDQTGLGAFIMTTQGPVLVSTLLEQQKTAVLEAQQRQKTILNPPDPPVVPGQPPQPGQAGARGAAPDDTTPNKKAAGAKPVYAEQVDERAVVNAGTHEKMLDDLRKFKTVVMKRLKAGKPIPAFESDVLPAGIVQTVQKMLAMNTAVEIGPAELRSRVNDVFEAITKAVSVEKKKASQRRTLERELRVHLAETGARIARHFEAGA
jgi:hypothetical protein